VLGAPASAEGSVQILDLTGRVLSAQTIAAGQTNGELNVAGLASGSYLVKVSIDGSTSVNSIVKQ
jgi:YbbR domain-containing protein